MIISALFCHLVVKRCWCCYRCSRKCVYMKRTQLSPHIVVWLQLFTLAKHNSIHSQTKCTHTQFSNGKNESPGGGQHFLIFIGHTSRTIRFVIVLIHLFSFYWLLRISSVTDAMVRAASVNFSRAKHTFQVHNAHFAIAMNLKLIKWAHNRRPMRNKQIINWTNRE